MCVILVDDGESMGEVQSLALCDFGLDVLPCLGLSRVGEQVHDDCSLLDGLINSEEVLAWDLQIGRTDSSKEGRKS